MQVERHHEEIVVAQPARYLIAERDHLPEGLCDPLTDRHVAVPRRRHLTRVGGRGQDLPHLVLGERAAVDLTAVGVERLLDPVLELHDSLLHGGVGLPAQEGPVDDVVLAAQDRIAEVTVPPVREPGKGGAIGVQLDDGLLGRRLAREGIVRPGDVRLPPRLRRGLVERLEAREILPIELDEGALIRCRRAAGGAGPRA